MSSRPDGRDESEYKGFKKWSRKQWAWEFLRRNTAFVEACRNYSEHPSKELAKEIAARFGITRFKHATERYRGGSRQRKKPLFAPSTIQFRVRLQEQDKVQYVRQMRVGEMVVRLDLHAATDKSASLAAQLRAVEKVARDQAKAYANLHGRAPLDIKIKHSDELLLAFLRMLDGTAAKIPQAELAKMIFPFLETVPPRTPAEWRNAIKSKWAAARDYADGGYLRLAVAPRKDSKKAKAK